ncbi:hypothetical protein BaRGS_00001722, partial [Batillaria attramentaria]
CKEWIQRTRRQELLPLTAAEVRSSGVCLCADHFEPSQFNRPAERNRLIWNAIPTVFPSVPNPPPRIDSLRKPPAVRRGPPKKKPRISEQPTAVDVTDAGAHAETVVESDNATKGRSTSATSEPLAAASSCNYDAPPVSTTSSPTKQKLLRARNKINRLKKKIKELKKNSQRKRKFTLVERNKNVLKELSHFLSGPILHLVTTQINHINL